MRVHIQSMTFRPRLACALGALVIAAVFGAIVNPLRPASASASVAASISPGHPKWSCAAPRLNMFEAGESNALRLIDYCRAREGVGPVILPSNWERLSGAEQLLVILNLERVNRGLAPILGLRNELDGLAEQGVKDSGDPPLPASADGIGSIWAGFMPDVLLADFAWMYADGWSPDIYAVQNIYCQTRNATGCWGHRNAIMRSGSDLSGGGAAGEANKHTNFTFEIVPFNSGAFTFTWASELKFFTATPRTEPLARPVLRSITPSSTQVGMTATTVTVTGIGLLGVKSFSLAGKTLHGVFCSSETNCTATVPASPTPKTASLSADGFAGRAKQTLSFTYSS